MLLSNKPRTVAISLNGLCLAALLIVGCKDVFNEESLSLAIGRLKHTNEVLRTSNSLLYDTWDRNAERLYDRRMRFWMDKGEAVLNTSEDLTSLVRDVRRRIDDKTMNGGLTRLQGVVGDSLFRQVAIYLNAARGALDTAPFADYPHLIDGMEKESKRLDSLFKCRLAISISDTSSNMTGGEWKGKYFNAAGWHSQELLLLQLEMDVLATAHELLAFCKSNTAGCRLGHASIHAIAVLSSSSVRSGETIEVTAGIGMFGWGIRPALEVNGVPFSGSDNPGVYKFTANGKPGNYVAHVTMSFDKPDGSKASVKKDLEYTITE